MAQVTIETVRNGPYIVKGEVELIDADGNKFPVEANGALPMRRFDRETVLRRHAFQDWFSSRPESRA